MTALMNGFTTEDMQGIDWEISEGFHQFEADDNLDDDHELWVYHRSGVIERAIAPAYCFEDEEWIEEYVIGICHAKGWEKTDVMTTAVNG